jgi:hypothetical protein
MLQTAVMRREVSTAEELVAAVNDPAVQRIEVTGEIAGAPPVRLAPGQHLVGAGSGAAVVFAHGVDGVCLSSDNELARIRLDVTPQYRAIFNDTAVPDLGTLRLTGVTTVGQVQIIAADEIRAGHVVVAGLDVVRADVRDRTERPALLGVEVLQGGFTLWNRQPDGAVALTAELHGISAGRAEAPIRGSGVFLAGAGAGAGAGGTGGTVTAGVVETGAVFTDGGIAAGTHDLISGGVFVLYGCRVELVRNRGPVTTFGVNDMALDNWGGVEQWHAEAPITSYGRSGVGFVNFGTITSLRIAAPVETHGVGARGFNVYSLDGFGAASVQTVEFDSITTHADAAVGIQIGQPIGRLTVHNGISTAGGAGESLVKGVITRLSAHALSVLAGGGIGEVTIGGAATSAGTGVAAVLVQGEIGRMRVAGGISARGNGSDALHVDGGVLGLYETELHAADGEPLRLTGATVTGMGGVTTRRHPNR